MIRRRRRVREIPFSFDSFLDVVANVVGIIIRLILVVWVGARSYSSVTAVPRPAPTTLAGQPAKEPTDPLQDEITRQRQELALAQAKLLEQLRQLQQVEVKKSEAAKELGTLVMRRKGWNRQREKSNRWWPPANRSPAAARSRWRTCGERGQKLAADIQALQQLPPLKKILRYKTPVSLAGPCRRAAVRVPGRPGGVRGRCRPPGRSAPGDAGQGAAIAYPVADRRRGRTGRSLQAPLRGRAPAGDARQSHQRGDALRQRQLQLWPERVGGGADCGGPRRKCACRSYERFRISPDRGLCGSAADGGHLLGLSGRVLLSIASLAITCTSTTSRSPAGPCPRAC